MKGYDIADNLSCYTLITIYRSIQCAIPSAETYANRRQHVDCKYL